MSSHPNPVETHEDAAAADDIQGFAGPQEANDASSATAPTPYDPMVKHALRYAALGYYVFPLYPIDGPGVCSCKRGNCKPGKHPIGNLVPSGHKAATIDPRVIETWWAEWPDAGIGIALEPSGLVVVGPDSIVWKERFEERGLPDTATTITGGGIGHEHYYYRRPDGCRLGRIIKSNRYDILSSGYAVAAPTLHESGRRYLVQRSFPDVDQLPVAPDWVVQELAGANQPKPVQSASSRPRHTGLGAVVTEMINDPRHLPAILPLLGVPGHAGPGSNGVHCPLGCHDTRKSASLWRGDNGVIAVHTHHGCQGDTTVWLPGAVYAGRKTGNMRQLSRPELASWSLKLLRDAGLINPAHIERPVAPGRFSKLDHLVLDAFCEVLALAQAVGVTEISFTRKFAEAWTGLTANQFKVAWDHIRDAKLVECAQEYGGRHSPGLWRLSAEPVDSRENP